jgi:hypothetical protein
MLASVDSSLGGDEAWWNGFWAPGTAGSRRRISADRVEALEIFEGETVAGDMFVTMDHLPTPNFAAWNGTTWRALGPVRPAPALHVVPNPTRADAIAWWNQGKAGEVSIDLFDPSGRRVGPARRNWMEAGSQSSPVFANTTGLAPGVYFLRVSAPGEVMRQKVLLLR